jgi:hypothetical protein
MKCLRVGHLCNMFKVSKLTPQMRFFASQHYLRYAYQTIFHSRKIEVMDHAWSLQCSAMLLNGKLFTKETKSSSHIHLSLSYIHTQTPMFILGMEYREWSNCRKFSFVEETPSAEVEDGSSGGIKQEISMTAVILSFKSTADDILSILCILKH